MKKRILVTGGAGFIGSHLTEKLINLGYNVLVVDNLKTIGGIKYINPKCKFLKGDITSEKTINKIASWKPETIYHLAAQSAGESSYDDPKYDYLSNGFGTYQLAKLAKKIKVKNFIYTSSVAVYGSNLKSVINEKSEIKPDSIYGITKYAGEMFIRQILDKTKTKTLILRLFNTFGPGEDLNYPKKGQIKIYCSYVWKKKPIIVKGSLKRFRNFHYIDDVIEILLRSLNNKKLRRHELINLCSGEKILVNQAIQAILKIKGLKKYKIIQTKVTPGDSFGYNGSNKKLFKKFKKFQFRSLEKGLIDFFRWIDLVPQKKDLKNYHPLKMKIINDKTP